MVIIKIDPPLQGEHIKPLLIDPLWDFFEEEWAEGLADELFRESVTVSGWGLNENNEFQDQLKKQVIQIGSVERSPIANKNGTLKLDHEAGHGICPGDSGGN